MAVIRLLCAAAATSAILLAVPPAGAAACGHDGVAVSGTAEEVADACPALSAVLGWFARHGYGVEPVVTVVFEATVTIDTRDASGGPDSGTAEVSGFYDNRLDTVRVASASRRADKTRAPWGIPWGAPIAHSILEHELAHAVMADLLGAAYGRVGRAYHEYVAYVVQFAVMDPALRGAVLAANPGIEPFPGREAVNGILLAADPEGFGIRAHLYAQTPDGAALLAEILDGRSPAGGSVDSFWTP
jgi:hypothetical protein